MVSRVPSRGLRVPRLGTRVGPTNSFCAETSGALLELSGLSGASPYQILSSFGSLTLPDLLTDSLSALAPVLALRTKL